MPKTVSQKICFIKNGFTTFPLFDSTLKDFIAWFLKAKIVPWIISHLPS